MMLKASRLLRAVAAALVLVAPTALAGQSVSPGARVRVKSPQVVAPIIGTYQSLRGDTVVVIEDGTAAKIWNFRTSTIDRLEVSAGMKGHNRGPMTKWALIGAGVGAGLGLITSIALESATDDQYSEFLSAAVGAGLGAIGGAAYGSRVLEENWNSVPIPRRVGFLPTRDGFRLGFSASF
jgi:hypothetical protein